MHPDEKRIFSRLMSQYSRGSSGFCKRTGTYQYEQTCEPQKGFWRFQVRRGDRCVSSREVDLTGCTLHLELLIKTRRTDRSEPYCSNTHYVKVRDRPRILSYRSDRGTFHLKVESAEYGRMEISLLASQHLVNHLIFGDYPVNAQTIENVLQFFL